MTIAILATGDEIVHGDTLNTNARDLAQVLSSEGLSLGLQVTCSDKEADITASLQFLCQAHDVIIIIGGLGPTTDDRTRFALASFTNEPLVQHEKAFLHVQKRLHAVNVALNEGNLQQCLFPAQAQILANPHGSALGCYYQWQGKTFILLPGPPRECLPMFHDYVMPLLRHLGRSHKEIIKWRIFGLAESEIADILEKALASIDCKTGYRLDVPYIEFKVCCKPDLVSTIKGIIDPILAPHRISSGDKKASEELHDLIVSLKEPITILDDATGGLLQSLISKPDTKPLLHFHKTSKTNLFFHLSGLDEFWTEQTPQGRTHVTIHYGNPKQEGGETHQLPYFGPLVVYYATEWFSFRLFHLMKQLCAR